MSALCGRFARWVLPVMLAACAGSDQAPERAPAPDALQDYQACAEPRPLVCTQQYEPVCAQRDTGIRCVTVPCDSSEWLRYSNACMACADPEVYGYLAGDCGPETAPATARAQPRADRQKGRP